MLTERLPRTLDARKAATRGTEVSGVLGPPDLPRFRALLATDEGSIQVRLSFSRDQENRYLVEARVEAEVTLHCQRCLEQMASTLNSENTLAILWREDEAGHLPKHLDPLILPQESCDLWALVEDELILGLPAFSYHERQDCNKILAELAARGIANSESEPGVGTRPPNPFDVLAQLKPGKKD